jgi:hypothetical protein
MQQKVETTVSPTPKTTTASTSPATSKAAAAPVAAPALPAVDTVTIPLTPALQVAYHDLYNAYEAQIESSNDPAVLEPLNASQLNVGNVLIKNSEYYIHANTALFTALQTQIKTTNTELKTVKDQITAIASKVAMAGTILSCINKVLTLVGV